MSTLSASKALLGIDSLEAMSLSELKRLAKQVSVPVTGPKGELVVRLLQARVSALDLQKADASTINADLSAMEASSCKRGTGGPSPFKPPDKHLDKKEMISISTRKL